MAYHNPDLSNYADIALKNSTQGERSNVCEEFYIGICKVQ